MSARSTWSHPATWIGIAVLAVIALSLVGALLLAALLYLAPRMPLAASPLAGALVNTKINIDNYDAILFGMTPQECDAILGPSVTADTATAHTVISQETAGRYLTKPMGVWSGVDEWRIWRGGGNCILVAFAHSQGGPLSNYSCWLGDAGEGWCVMQAVGVGQDLDKIRADRQKEERERKDPKWAKGAQIRQLLVGSWRDAANTAGIDFGADGTVTQHFLFDAQRQPYRTAYRFTDDEHVEFTAQNPFNAQLLTASRCKVLVTKNELILLEQRENKYYRFGTYSRM
jgi:hypothetical protein